MSDQAITEEVEIVVWCESEIFGNDEFWRGKPSQIPSIQNIPARDLAEDFVKYQIPHKSGMWRVGTDQAKETPMEIMKRNGLRWERTAMKDGRAIFDKEGALAFVGTPQEVYEWLCEAEKK